MQFKVENMSIRKLLLAGIVISLMAISCTTISYVPQINLDISSKTILGSVQIEKFVDNSDIGDRKNPFLGLSVTNEEALANDLSVSVTNAIVSDFSNNAVFNRVSRRIESPDYTIKGEIKVFKGISRLTDYGTISFITIVGIYTWFLGMPIEKIETEIEIKLEIFDRNNMLIGTYVGNAVGFRRTSMYRNIALATPSQTNRDFSKAIEQIREQIIKDEDRFN